MSRRTISLEKLADAEESKRFRREERAKLLALIDKGIRERLPASVIVARTGAQRTTVQNRANELGVALPRRTDWEGA